ncbi:epithelial-stromal interaction protein 1-like [Haliotis asinina]|uniref:epithelial-stromal interaction protein 1-like n=1 Tax=Haliotis asinina TaxID=109174 RepID=UPI0035325D9A
MSKTFTARPSVSSRTRGSTRGPGNQTAARGGSRGRGTPTGRGRGAVSNRSDQNRANPSTRRGMYNRGEMGSRGGRGGTYPPRRGGTFPPRPGEEDDGGATGAEGGTEQRISHQGAYSVISPNEKKRQQISEQARRETEAYERHKAENKPGHVSYHGTVGGGEITEGEARRNMAMKNMNAKYNMLEQRKKRKEEEKRVQEEEFLKKKMEGRRKTEENKRRAEREDAKKHEEMDRIKNKFLERFERSAPKAVPSKTSSASVAIPSRSCDPQPHSHPVNEPQRPVRDQPKRERDTHQMSSEMNSDLATLHAMFPQYSQDAIDEIYSQSGSLEVTAGILADQ